MARERFPYESRLRVGFALDRRYAFLMGAPQGDKEVAILEIARIFKKLGIPYAIIGGVAVQVHTEEPRTTLDLDIALKSRSDIPEQALKDAGFKHEGTFEFSDNWRAVQFSADDLTAEAVDGSGTVTLEGVDISVVSPRDLVILKVAAALEPRRRQSKRITDYGDIVRLLEEHEELVQEIPGIEKDLQEIRSML